MDLDKLLANTADGVCAIGSDGKIVFWNRSAEKILGHSAREVIGRPCCEVFIGLDADGNRLCHQGCHVMTLVKKGDLVQHFDMATRGKTGKPVWLNISILVVPGTRPDVATTVHLFRDVTASHEIEALVRERLSETRAQAPEPATGAQTLTRRETEILRLMTSGANTKAMAERLHVSRATVRNHVQNLFSKLAVHSRLEAVAYATRHHLL